MIFQCVVGIIFPGIIESNASLKTLQKDEYSCSLCADSYSPTLDEMVDVTFTVNPKLRRIDAHTPSQLPLRFCGFPLDGRWFIIR